MPFVRPLYVGMDLGEKVILAQAVMNVFLTVSDQHVGCSLDPQDQASS
jgi:hypothetical protein